MCSSMNWKKRDRLSFSLSLLLDKLKNKSLARFYFLSHDTSLHLSIFDTFPTKRLLIERRKIGIRRNYVPITSANFFHDLALVIPLVSNPFPVKLLGNPVLLDVQQGRKLRSLHV